jgi:peptidyl-prolyl cis-trans isomerase D
MLDAMRKNAQSWIIKILFGIIILVFIFYMGTSRLGKEGSGVVAYVNEEPITLQEYKTRYEQYVQMLRSQYPNLDEAALKAMGARHQAFDQAVDRLLLLQKAAELNIGASEEEMRKTIAEMPVFHNAQGVFDSNVYKQLLSANAMTAGQFEGGVKNQIISEKTVNYLTLPAKASEYEVRQLYDYSQVTATVDYVSFQTTAFLDKAVISDADIEAYYQEHQNTLFITPKLIAVEYALLTPSALAKPDEVTADEIKAYYEARKSDYWHPEQVHARHIIVMADEKATEEQVAKAKAEIEGIAAKIKGGMDFVEAANKFSQGSAAQNGGDLGWIGRGRTVKEFEDVAFALAPGQVSEPVRTGFGWHLIKVDERRPEGETPLADVEATIRNLVAEEKAAALVERLTDEADTRLSAGEDLAKVAADLGLTLAKSPLFPPVGLPPELGLTPDTAAPLFLLSAGQTLPTPILLPDGIFLGRVVETKPEGVKPLDEAKTQIVDQLKVRKAGELAKAKARETLDELRDPAKKDEAEKRLAKDILHSEPFTRQGQVPGLGQAKDLAEAVFLDPKGGWLDAVYTSLDGVYIARPTGVTPPSEEMWEKDKADWTTRVETQRSQDLYQSLIKSLRNEAKIEILAPEVIE